jgi:hypothetical protein
LKEYKPGTFDRHVAYGQRERKLMLVTRGVMDGFKVRCQSAKEAENLAHAFRVRCRRIEERGTTKYSLRVRVEERTIYVTRKGLLQR